MASISNLFTSITPMSLIQCFRLIRNRILNKDRSDLADAGRKDPLDYVSPFVLDAAVSRVKTKPNILLSNHETRSLLTLARYDALTKHFGLQTIEGEVGDAVDNALKHNRDTLVHSVDMTRPEWIVYPLVGIQQIRDRRKSATVLSVGPRSESELFTLMSIGFKPENVYGLDLFTYSPMIKIGDMHDMPYDDDTFDVIILGWVYSYSGNWPKLTSEVKRCAKDRAVIAISADYSVYDENNPSKDEKVTHVQNADVILDSFGEAVRNVYFRQDAEPPHVTSSMVLFDIEKD